MYITGFYPWFIRWFLKIKMNELFIFELFFE